MNIVSIRLYLLLLILSALVGISSVYADYHVEVNGWWFDTSNNNHSISGSADISVGDSKTLYEWGSFGQGSEFTAHYRKFGDIEGVYVVGGVSYCGCKILKPTITVNGTPKSFYLDHESLNDYKVIETTFVFPQKVSGSGDTYEWHIEGVIKYEHIDEINNIDNTYKKTFNDSGTISVGGVVVKEYFANPKKEHGIDLHEGGFVMVMKCYKEGDKTKINVTIVPTCEIVYEKGSIEYENHGYWGSGNITINNKPFSFNFIRGDLKSMWFNGNSPSPYKIQHTWDVTNASTVGGNQPVKSPIPLPVIIIALLSIPIIALRKLN